MAIHKTKMRRMLPLISPLGTEWISDFSDHFKQNFLLKLN